MSVSLVKRDMFMRIARNIAKRHELGGPDKGEFADVTVMSRKNYDGRTGYLILCDYVSMIDEQFNSDIMDILDEHDMFAEAVNGSMLGIYYI